jgi:hypothetical protein
MTTWQLRIGLLRIVTLALISGAGCNALLQDSEPPSVALDGATAPPSDVLTPPPPSVDGGLHDGAVADATIDASRRDGSAGDAGERQARRR